MNNHASILEWLTAIGTVAAVVVAITIAALPAIRKWLHRPRLHVVVGDVEPHMRVALDSNSNEDGVWILAEVQNDGATEVTNVRAVVQKVWTSASSGPWIECDIVPMQMHWLSWPDPDKTPAPSDGVSIAGKVSGYLDLFLANKDALHVLAQDRRPQLFERVLRPMPQVSRAQLIVVADNAKATTVVVECSVQIPPLWASMRPVSDAPRAEERIGDLRNRRGA